MSKERKNPAVLGLDMGGTHTDAVLLRGGTLLASVKVPTNHQDLLVSTREALHALFESGAAFPADVSRATFGTTLAVTADGVRLGETDTVLPDGSDDVVWLSA